MATGGKRHEFTEEKREVFINALREGYTVVGAAKLAKANRQSFYDFKNENEAFAGKWDVAYEEGTDLLEAEAHRRGVEGVSKPVYQGGKLVGHVQEYSDTLLIFTLKARRPGKYRDNIDVKHSGSIDLGQFVKAIADPA